MGKILPGANEDGSLSKPGCMYPDALRAALGREPKRDEASKQDDVGKREADEHERP
jgi:hypothetical protein